MHHIKRIGLFLTALVRSGHIGGSWVWSGMIAGKMKRNRRHVV